MQKDVLQSAQQIQLGPAVLMSAGISEPAVIKINLSRNDVLILRATLGCAFVILDMYLKTEFVSRRVSAAVFFQMELQSQSGIQKQTVSKPASAFHTATHAET